MKESRKVDTVEVPHVTDQTEKYVSLTVNIPALCDKRSTALMID